MAFCHRLLQLTHNHCYNLSEILKRIRILYSWSQGFYQPCLKGWLNEYFAEVSGDIFSTKSRQWSFHCKLNGAFTLPLSLVCLLQTYLLLVYTHACLLKYHMTPWDCAWQLWKIKNFGLLSPCLSTNVPTCAREGNSLQRLYSCRGFMYSLDSRHTAHVSIVCP